MTMDMTEHQLRHALDEERHTHLLQNALQCCYPQVTRLVELREQDAGERLLDFVCLYIRSAPVLLDDLQKAARYAGAGDCIQPLVDIGREFFDLPARVIGHRSGLTAMMVKAYLAHRLLEEVNEACLFRTGHPMIAMDLTLANLIVHTLIGEPFANDMDQLVNTAVTRLFSRYQQQEEKEAEPGGWFSRLQPQNLVQICQRWPSLSQQAGLHSALH